MAVFDTLRAARTLRAAGFGDAKAEAVAEVVQAVANGNRVTRADMQGVAMKVDLERFATKAELQAELRRFATKEDLERFATKAELQTELQRLATKKDLERFATKEDLAPFATKAELKSEIQELELRLTIRTGVMIAASSTITTALIVGLIRLLP